MRVWKVAGPDRPIPQPKVANHDVKDIEGKSTGSYGIDARSIASNASSGASNLYNRLGNALSERGYVTCSDLLKQSL